MYKLGTYQGPTNKDILSFLWSSLVLALIQIPCYLPMKPLAICLAKAYFQETIFDNFGLYGLLKHL